MYRPSVPMSASSSGARKDRALRGLIWRLTASKKKPPSGGYLASRYARVTAGGEKMILREFVDPASLAPMSDTTFFTASQYESLCNGLPDPTFILTESGRYAAVLGGKDQRYYHDATALVGQFIADVLAPAKAQWFLQQIREALSSQRCRWWSTS
jgi:hypothetical protein